MAGQSPAQDLTARTFDRLRERALDLLRRRVGDVAYGDYIATGVVPAILDVVAWFHEQAAHYHDRRRRNSYLFLADTRESMVILARAQGYRMRPTTSAAVSVIAVPQPPQVAPVTLERGTRITVSDLVFEVAQDAVIPAGAAQWPDGTTDDLILLVEGVTREEQFISDGAAWQSFELGQLGTIDGSVQVVILGETWEEVDNLTYVEGGQRGRDSYAGDGTDGQVVELTLLGAHIRLEDDDGIVVLVTPAGSTTADVQTWQQVDALTGAPREYLATQDVDGVTRLTFGTATNGAAPLAGDAIDVLYVIAGKQKRYQLDYDEFDQATIRFGDDIYGVIPPNGAAVQVTYRTGGGIRGNVAGGVIEQTIQGKLPTGASTPVLIRNIEAGRGGEEAETVEHARFFAPRFAKSNERAVTADDWTALAATYRDETFGAPSHASAYLKQSVPELNTVVVALWGRDDVGRLSSPGTALKVGVKKYLDTKRTITTTCEMADGVVVLIDITVAVVLETGRDRQVVFAAVTEAIERFFDSAYVLPGLDLSISRLYDTIQGVDGVSRATIDEVVGSVAAYLTLGVGDGSTAEWSGDFTLDDGTGVVPGSVAVTDQNQQVVDDGDGGFLGDVDGAGTNTVTYSNGRFTATFAAPPPLGANITAEAKLLVYAPHVEDIGASDGGTDLDGATDYYPIVERAPRGVWAREQSIIIDDFRVGSTNRFRGRLPRGIDTASIVIGDNVPGAPVLVGNDNGLGVIVGAGILTGSVSYATGDIDFEFNAVPTLPVRIDWTTQRVQVFLPTQYLPLESGRVWFWGGYRGSLGTQPGGADLNAYDDGEANMAGDVLVAPSGVITYENGEADFQWNGALPPVVPAPLWGYLMQVPDGIRTEFDWEVWTAPGGVGGAGSVVDLRDGASSGEGRTRLLLTDLSTVGISYADAWDNWQGAVHGDSLDEEGENTLSYAPQGVNVTAGGKLAFEVPPAAGAPQDFRVSVTAVGVMMYSAWVYRVKTAGGPGLDKYAFADNGGRLWGTTANPYPTDRLDHLRGRYRAVISGAALPAGRAQELTYDALVAVPPARDIPLQGDQVASVGRITLEETAPEVVSLG